MRVFTGHKVFIPQGTGGLVLNHSNLNLERVFSGGSGSHSYDKSKCHKQMPGFLNRNLEMCIVEDLEAVLDM